MMPNETDDAKRRKLDGTGDVPTHVPLCLCTRLTDFCLAPTSDVRNWLAEIGLSRYADQLIAKGLDDLQDLKQEADLKELKIRLRKDGTMLVFHLDKLIRKLEAFRAPIVKESAIIAPTAWALVATSAEGASASALAPVSALAPAPITAPALGKPVPDYSQARHALRLRPQRW